MRGIVFAGALALAVAAGFALSGSDHSEIYDIPIAQVSAEMLRTDVPRGVRSGLMATDDVEVKTGPGHRVEWKFRRGQLYVGSLVAIAEPKGDSSTTLTVAFDPGSASAENQKVSDAQDFITTVGLPVMYETIDAKIEGRSVNAQIEEQAMASYVKKNLSAIGRGTQATFDEVGREPNEAHTESTQTEFISRPPEAYTKPSLDLSGGRRDATDIATDSASEVMP